MVKCPPPQPGCKPSLTPRARHAPPCVHRPPARLYIPERRASFTVRFSMLVWRNWQTRTVQVRVGQPMEVRVLSRARRVPGAVTLHPSSKGLRPAAPHCPAVTPSTNPPLKRILLLFWRAIARRLRPPGGKSEHLRAARRVSNAGPPCASATVRKVSQKLYHPDTREPQGRGCGARVKWRGKSSPPREQSRGQEKPRAVQDRTGGDGPSASSGTRPPGIGRIPLRRDPASAGREMIATRQPCVGGNRIRLTARTPAIGGRSASRAGPHPPAPSALVPPTTFVAGAIED